MRKAFSICFSQSSHTLHVLHQKSSFSVQCNKTLQKCNQNPFFLEPQALQKISPETHFSSFFSPYYKKWKGRYLRPFLILMFVPPGHMHLGKKSQKSKKSPQNILHLTLFLRIPVLPPPSHPSRWGECLI